jgi:hypothetical protein
VSACLLISTSGCGDDDSGNTIIKGGLPVTVTTDVANVESGKQVAVSASVTAVGGPFTYAWSATAGRFSDPTAESTTWTAPEEMGQFSLSCVVDNMSDAGLGSADVTVTLYVPMDTPFYRGAEICAGCHAQDGAPGGNQYEPWSESHHAKAFSTLEIIGQDENTFCVGCHTVGTEGLYTDEPLDNGGYDDTAVTRLQNVQCENCHGPASDHPSPVFNSVGVTLEAELCGGCHNGPHHPTFEEWQMSGHATPIDFAAGRASCAPCHNGLEGPRFLDDPEAYIPLPVDPPVIIAHTCATCHDPHGNDNPGNLRNASVNDVALPNGILQPAGGAGKLCMSCHNGRRTDEDVDDQIQNGADHFGPHHSVQGDMISGVNAYEDIAPAFDFSTSLHINVQDACVTCHTHPHEGDLENGIENFTGHTFEPTVEACQPCHGDIGDFDDILAKADFDGNGMVEGVQTEIQGLLDILEQTIIDASVTSEAMMALEEDFEGNLGDPLLTTREQRAAGYNWTFVAFDASTGVHNAVYSIQLLQQSILSLDPGALGIYAVVLEQD